MPEIKSNFLYQQLKQAKLKLLHQKSCQKFTMSSTLFSERRHKKKVLQALIPLLMGMKSAGAAIFAFTVVAAITIKAFIVSKLALLVTGGLAVKKLYETWGSG